MKRSLLVITLCIFAGFSFAQKKAVKDAKSAMKNVDEARELIKIKVQRSVNDEIKQIANTLAEKCDAEVVSIIGSKILLYKYTSKPKFNHLI